MSKNLHKYKAKVQQEQIRHEAKPKVQNTLSDEDVKVYKRFQQKLRSTTFENFMKEMNRINSNAYAMSENHWKEAIFITLPPKLQKAVHEQVIKIRGHWDGMITIPSVQEQELDESLIVSENKFLKRQLKKLEARVKELEGLDGNSN